ncbi:MAG: hypothetical protein WCW30_05060 [Candidatus Gracilibacteria bacterium]
MKLNNYTFAIFFSVVAAIITSIIISKIMMEQSMPQTAQCGTLGREEVPYETPLHAKTTSLVQEMEPRTAASYLTDKNLETFAYPQSLQVDYLIEFSQLYPFRSFDIVWGEYGKTDNYIQEWELLGCNRDAQWVQLGYGLFPGEEITTVSVDIPVSQLRLKASSAKDWIGVYELEFEGALRISSIT